MPQKPLITAQAMALALLSALASAQPPLVLGTIAGSPDADFVDGFGREARFQSPAGMTLDGDTVYIADSANHAIRALDVTTGEVTTVAGTGMPGFVDGPVETATFNTPRDVLYDPSHHALLVADSGNNVIRKIDLSSGEVSTYAGTGTAGWADGYAEEAQFNEPSGLCFLYPTGGAVQGTEGASQYGPTLVVADTGNHCLREISDYGSGGAPGGDAGQIVTPSARFVTTPCGRPKEPGFADGSPNLAQFNRPVGVKAEPGFTSLLIADSGNHAIRRFHVSLSEVDTVQGDGTPGDEDSPPEDVARFNTPLGIGLGPDGWSWIGDSGNHRVRRLDAGAQAPVVETVVGSVPGYLDGPLPHALLNHPWAIVSASERRRVPVALISDQGNNCIRAIGENAPPFARTGGPYSVGPGQGLVFDGSKSFDPDVLLGDHITEWVWDLNNDGTPDGSGETLFLSPLEVWQWFGDSRPGVTYPYSRRIALRVMDLFGATDTASTLVTVTGDLAPAFRPTLLPEPPWTKGTENRLEWTGVEGATAYELQWSRTANFGVVVGSLLSTKLTGLATGLSHNTTYYYRARGLFGEGADAAADKVPGLPGPWSNIEYSTQDTRAPESAFSVPSDPLQSNTARTRLPWTATESGSGFANMCVWYSFEGGPLTRYPGRWPADGVTPLPGKNEVQATGNLVFDVAHAAGEGSYELWLSGRDNVGNDEAINGHRDLRLIVDATPPEITDIVVSNITTTTADVSWRTSERCTCELTYGESPKDANKLSTGPSKSHQVYLTGLTPDTEYCFEIQATDDCGNKARSELQTFRTGRPEPLVITDIEVTNVTRHTADIAWRTNRRTISFVEYGPTRSYGCMALSPAFSTRHRVHLSGLEAGTLYHFRITALDTNGMTAVSPDQTLRTVRPAPPVILDIQVRNITRTSADVLWATDKLTTGVVDYGTTARYGSQEPDAMLARKHRVHLAGLTPGMRYHFRITATDRIGLSSRSGDETFATPPGRPEAPALNPEPEFTKGTSNHLAWSGVPWAVKYRLEVATNAAFTHPNVVETVAGNATASDLTDGVTYYYRVAGVNAANVQGPYSNVEHSTQDGSPPETYCERTSAPAAAPPGACVELGIRGSDAASGVSFILLFYAKDRGPFEQYGGRWVPGDRARFDFSKLGGGHYAFYTVGVDNVGNREAPPAAPDVEVDVRIPTAVAYAGDYGTTTGENALIAGVLTDAFGRAIPGATISYTLGSLSGALASTNGAGLARAVISVPLPPGSYSLTLSYAGGATLAPCSTTIVFVVKPVVSPPGARVDVVGQGRVVDPAGEQFAFNLTVSSNPLGGTVRVTIGAKVLRATSITGVGTAGTVATITGIATIDGMPGHRFVIRVADGAPDRFGMTATDGTYIGLTDLISGSVTITATP